MKISRLNRSKRQIMQLKLLERIFPAYYLRVASKALMQSYLKNSSKLRLGLASILRISLPLTLSLKPFQKITLKS